MFNIVTDTTKYKTLARRGRKDVDIGTECFYIRYKQTNLYFAYCYTDLEDAKEAMDNLKEYSDIDKLLDFNFKTKKEHCVAVSYKET